MNLKEWYRMNQPRQVLTLDEELRMVYGLECMCPTCRSSVVVRVRLTKLRTGDVVPLIVFCVLCDVEFPVFGIVRGRGKGPMSGEFAINLVDGSWRRIG